MPLDELSRIVTGRDRDLFQDDLQEHHEEILARLSRHRVLVVGGAGSIGAATIKALIPYRPSALHVVDQNENNLAELVRDVRSSRLNLSSIDFQLFPLDFGSGVMQRLILDTVPYDFVLNFAAVKHVRSEKNVYSLLHMLDTNVVKAARLLTWLQEQGNPVRYFCVSTDKAANPVNFMGASKRIMERMIFSSSRGDEGQLETTSARFANVAFSEGSLLDSFLRRIRKRQPLAAPRNTRRFFITLRESGQICLLATVLAPDNHILFPHLDPQDDLIEMEEVARRILKFHGYKPEIFEDEEAAKKRCEAESNNGFYPLLLTPLDTSGEKPYEEFVGEGEESVDMGMKNLSAIRCPKETMSDVMDFITRISRYVASPEVKVNKEAILEEMRRLIPPFRHVETGRSLDQRM